MPLRGESVGTAYIRLIADGSGIPGDIEDALNDASGRFDDAGSRDAKLYKKAFAEELEKHDDHALRDAFNKALVADDAIDEFFSSPRWHRTETNFRARFGSLGTAAADEIREKFTKAGSLGGIENDIERVTRRVNDIADRAIAENARVTQQRALEAENFEKRFRAAMEESSEVSKRVSRENVDNLENLRRTLERLRTSTITSFSRELSKARTELNDTGRDVDVNRSRFARFAVTIDHIAEGVGRAFGRGSRNDLLNFIGTFVKGSVSLLGLPARLLGNISEFGIGFKDAKVAGDGFFAAIRAGFTQAASDAEGGATALSGFFSSGIAAAPLLAVALVGVVTVLGVVASLISGIVAALIALVSTIAFGIVGALTPLVGLLGPIGLGIGTIVLGIATLDNKSKKALKEAVKPLIDGLKDLGEVARTGFLDTFDRSLPGIASRLDRLTPLVRAISRAFGEVGNQIVDSFDSPTLRRFLNQMTTFAPQAIGDLASAFGNLARAFTAIFTDSIPVTRRFLNFLDDVTGDFADFVTANPKKVTDFLKSAADSAKILARFLGSVADLIGTLITAGKGTGDDLFTRLTKNIEHFTDTLSPKAQAPTVFDEATGGIKRFQDNAGKLPKTDPLKGFFANGKQTAEDLGEIAKALGEIAGVLDSVQSSKFLHDILDGITFALDKLQGPVKFLTEHPLTTFFSVLLGPAGPALASVQVFFDTVWQPIRDFARKVDDFLHKFQFKGGLGGRIADLFSGLNLGGGGTGGIGALTIKPPSLDWIPGTLGRIRDLARNIGNAFDPVAGLVRHALNPIGISAGQIVTQVARFFGGLPGRLSNLAPGFAHAASTWAAQILARLSDLPQQIVDFFSGLGHRIVDAIGSINIHINWPDPPSWLSKITGPLNPLGALIPRTGSGGIFDGAQFRIIGERGPEAVVPLTGPLDLVDPAVRWLASIARGMTPTTSSSAAGKTINNEWHISTPTSDARAVASELLNAMVASAY